MTLGWSNPLIRRLSVKSVFSCRSDVKPVQTQERERGEGERPGGKEKGREKGRERGREGEREEGEREGGREEAREGERDAIFFISGLIWKGLH